MAKKMMTVRPALEAVAIAAVEAVMDNAVVVEVVVLISAAKVRRRIAIEHLIVRHDKNNAAYHNALHSRVRTHQCNLRQQPHLNHVNKAVRNNRDQQLSQHLKRLSRHRKRK